jgi:hypothetical protein
VPKGRRTQGKRAGTQVEVRPQSTLGCEVACVGAPTACGCQWLGAWGGRKALGCLVNGAVCRKRTGSVTSLVSPSRRPKAVLPMTAALGRSAAARHARKRAGASPMPATRNKSTAQGGHQTRPGGPGATLVASPDAHKHLAKRLHAATLAFESRPRRDDVPSRVVLTSWVSRRCTRQAVADGDAGSTAVCCPAPPGRLRRRPAVVAGGRDGAWAPREMHHWYPLALRALRPAVRGGGFRVALPANTSDASFSPRRCCRQASTDAALSVAERLVVTHDAALAVRVPAAVGES